MRQTDRFTFFFTKADVFSNWHPAWFTLRGIRFNCVEQAMMYAKAVEFGDQATAQKILEAADPKEQKRLGRLVTPYDDARWQRIARPVVYAATKAKFTQNAHLLDKLLATGATTLVEASPYDSVWGVGLGERDPRIEDPSKWRGTNWLGQVLTRLRDDLVAEMAPQEERRPSL